MFSGRRFLVSLPAPSPLPLTRPISSSLGKFQHGDFASTLRAQRKCLHSTPDCRLTVKTLRLTVTSPLGAWGWGGGRAFGKLCVPLKTSWLRPCALQSKEPSPGVTWIFFSVVAVCNMSEITHSSPFKDAGLQAEVYTSTLIVCWPLLQPVIIISQAINAKNLNYTELKPSRCRLLRLLSPPNSKINGLSLNLNIVRLNRSFFFWNRLNTI